MHISKQEKVNTHKHTIIEFIFVLGGNVKSC